jgi:hypothetical protein
VTAYVPVGEGDGNAADFRRFARIPDGVEPSSETRSNPRTLEGVKWAGTST